MVQMKPVIISRENRNVPPKDDTIDRPLHSVEKVQKKSVQPDGLLVQQENAFLRDIHRALPFRKELGWIVLPNLPYSPPDTALTDYHLFWSLSSVLHCVSFNNDV
ncbi:hypothetical protein T01_13812 [Trichinella spiralis]|uniref:Histone-lysine N-methyltransferase SETMAR n=1 Tax=Trichinella spiralis TaxID=6334 RepID=A0A0V1AM86_TRISP|nr:hypothetical protein T01_13812 [Trichinella spiralis]